MGMACPKTIATISLRTRLLSHFITITSLCKINISFLCVCFSQRTSLKFGNRICFYSHLKSVDVYLLRHQKRSSGQKSRPELKKPIFQIPLLLTGNSWHCLLSQDLLNSSLLLTFVFKLPEPKQRQA